MADVFQEEEPGQAWKECEILIKNTTREKKSHGKLGFIPFKNMVDGSAQGWNSNSEQVATSPVVNSAKITGMFRISMG